MINDTMETINKVIIWKHIGNKTDGMQTYERARIPF